MKNAHEVFNAEDQSPEEQSSEADKNVEIQRERSWSDSASTIQSFANDDERRLSEISRRLEGTLGADLMALAHAAQMVGENSRMASQEASQSVKDVHMAQQSILDAEKRANKAENAVRIMYKKQNELISQLEKTKKERNVLKRQVKALLQEKSVNQEQDKVVRALELHVAKALQAHEYHLSLQHAKRKEKDSRNVATVRLECPSQDEGVTGKVDAEVDEEHISATQEMSESKATAVKSEKLVDIAAEKTVKLPHSEASTQKPQAVSLRGSVGFGSAIGFGGFGMPSSFCMMKQKPESNLIAQKTLETKEDLVEEPA